MRISDWSSDVCSSDLLKPSTLLRPQTAIKKINRKPNEINGLAGHPYASARSPTVTFDNENKSTPKVTVLLDGTTDGRVALGGEKIGRASGRERVCQYVEVSVVGVSLKKKKIKH